MSDYQGKRFSASRIPDPAKSGAARAPQQVGHPLLNSRARRAP